tara:strand:- start:491 stop:895 length:405 start_codon:yes stop_codon:yes gene_type:complete
MPTKKKKKSAKKKTTRKKSPKKTSSRSKSIEKLLIENFIELQKIQTGLSIKFETLAGEISKLLTLFETSAKSFMEKQGTQINKEDKAFLEKLDRLIDQNKVIAKGLTLMEERMREKVTTPPQRHHPGQRPPPRP